MKKLVIAFMLCLALNALAQDNLIQGYDYSSSTGLMSWTTLRDLVEKARFDQYVCDATNSYYMFNPTYFFADTNAGTTNYFINIKPNSLTSDLLAGGGYPTLTGNNTWSGSNEFTGTFLVTSNDMAVSFMGFPKLSLTTNMVTSISIGGSGTPISPDAFTNIFDNDMSTYSTGVVASRTTWYIIDLGANYKGWCNVKTSLETSTGAAIWVEPLTTRTTNQVISSTLYPSYVVGGRQDWNAATGRDEGAGHYPVDGRYISFAWWETGGGTASYRVYDFSVYGTTNAYRNMGGF